VETREFLIQSLIDEGYLKTPRIIEAFRAIDRADFVLLEYAGEAYGNYPLPIGHNQTISQPLTVAFLLELLDPRPGEKILDVGSGSGWTTALLASIVGEKGRVFAIERIPELCEFGKRNLAKYFGEDRAKIICGDATEGFLKQAPFDPAPFADDFVHGAKRQSVKGAGFDKILAGAAAFGEIPEVWKEQLKIGGRIVAPVGGSIKLYIKKSEGKWEEKEFPGFSFVPLVKNKLPSEGKKGKNGRRGQFGHLFIIGLAALIALGILFANEIYAPHTSFRGVQSVEIAAGSGSRKIGEILKKEGVIRSKWIFVAYVILSNRASKLKPGNYDFKSDTTVLQTAKELVRGESSEEVIVIPEGWSVKDIAFYFENKGMFQAEELMELAGFPNVDYRKAREMPVPKDFSADFSFLQDKPLYVGLEGYLFPDTHRVFRVAKLEDIVRKMLDNFDKKLTLEMRTEILRQKKTIFEIITIASLIEKEVRSDEDRALVSGVLWKRLEFGIPLQVDATISYITGKKGERISKEETKIDSPFNTYKYHSLPLGPITNPGISSIRAAIFPKNSPYLYYLSTPDGQTVFSKTLDEHNEAKVKYLK